VHAVYMRSYAWVYLFGSKARLFDVDNGVAISELIVVCDSRCMTYFARTNRTPRTHGEDPARSRCDHKSV
jgi:hypothetical protein